MPNTINDAKKPSIDEIISNQNFIPDKIFSNNLKLEKTNYIANELLNNNRCSKKIAYGTLDNKEQSIKLSLFERIICIFTKTFVIKKIEKVVNNIIIISETKKQEAEAKKQETKAKKQETKAKKQEAEAEKLIESLTKQIEGFLSNIDATSIEEKISLLKQIESLLPKDNITAQSDKLIDLSVTLIKKTEDKQIEKTQLLLTNTTELLPKDNLSPKQLKKHFKEIKQTIADNKKIYDFKKASKQPLVILSNSLQNLASNLKLKKLIQNNTTILEDLLKNKNTPLDDTYDLLEYLFSEVQNLANKLKKEYLTKTNIQLIEGFKKTANKLLDSLEKEQNTQEIHNTFKQYIEALDTKYLPK